MNERVEAEAKSWLPPLFKTMLEMLRPVAPAVRPDGSLAIRWTGASGLESEAPIPWLKLHDNRKPIVIRRFRFMKERWSVHYQVLDLEDQAEEYSYELADAAHPPFLPRQSPSEFRSAVVHLEGDDVWRPTFRLPNRQAPVFLGREKELADLNEWFGDTDVRVCNLYGEGGIGKTSLALEFLHRVLEGSVEPLSWRPDLIVFASFKRTKWSSSGLERLTVAGAIESLLLEVHHFFSPQKDRSLLTASCQQLIDRLASVLTECGLTRDSLLLILDNTESLEAVGPERTEVASAIKQIAKRVGRVLVTSRIREDVAATPIELRGFTEEEGVQALRRFGQAYGADALLQASDPNLRQVARKLGGRPLTLEALARFVGRFRYGIDAGLNEIFRQAETDLGAFLYEDAWADLGENVRRALILLGLFANPDVDDELARRIAANQNLHIDDLALSLERSHLGRRLLIGSTEEYFLGETATKYLLAKHEDFAASERESIRKSYDAIKGAHELRKRAQQATVRDRLAAAFRTSEARAAHMANLTNDIPGAVSWFEEAVQKDSGNPALLDRFAWFLMIRAKDLDRAEALAREAVRVDADFAEAHFTLGMVLARKGDVRGADTEFARALALGKPQHLCELQRSRARTTFVEKALEGEQYVSRRDLRKHLKDADELCSRAQQEHERSLVDQKHNEECRARSVRIARLLRRVEDRSY